MDLTMLTDERTDPEPSPLCSFKKFFKDWVNTDHTMVAGQQSLLSSHWAPGWNTIMQLAYLAYQ